jgi:hypothetical protein
MSATFDTAVVRPLQETLNRHPVYEAVASLEDIRIFMRHHVYPVWDFMSVLKYLQAKIAPAVVPWTPRGAGAVRRLINSLVLEEESDESLPNADGHPVYASHFELYCHAMREVGADAQAPLRFVERVRVNGVRAALRGGDIPEPSRRFVEKTFDLIETDRPHLVAAAFALGREHIIPGMFRALLHDMKLTAHEAPAFHFYLNRHIHLDEDFHAPLSLQLLNELCEGKPEKVREAEAAAVQAIEERIRFWDGVLEALRSER